LTAIGSEYIIIEQYAAGVSLHERRPCMNVGDELRCIAAITRRWEELGLEGTCPYPLPRPDELADHQKDYRRFEAAQQLRQSVSSQLNTASDGWVPAECFEKTENEHRELFVLFLKHVL
jgi:hypothetical protein